MKHAAARIKKIVPGSKGKIRPRIPTAVNTIPITKKASRLPSCKFFVTDSVVSKFVAHLKCPRTISVFLFMDYC